MTDMGLMERTKNLLTTNLEELGSDKDAPSRLKRYVKDLEWTHRELGEAARHASVERRSLESRLEGAGGTGRLWSDRAALALRRREESLARLALLRKIEVETDTARLAQRITRVTERERALDHEMQQLRERILATRYLRKVLAAGDAAPSAARVSEGLFEEVERELDALKRSLGVALDRDGESA